MNNAAIEILIRELDSLLYKVETLSDGNLTDYMNIKVEEIRNAITLINNK